MSEFIDKFLYGMQSSPENTIQTDSLDLYGLSEEIIQTGEFHKSFYLKKDYEQPLDQLKASVCIVGIKNEGFRIQIFSEKYTHPYIDWICEVLPSQVDC